MIVSSRFIPVTPIILGPKSPLRGQAWAIGARKIWRTWSRAKLRRGALVKPVPLAGSGGWLKNGPFGGWWFGCHQFYFPMNIGFMSSSRYWRSHIFQRGGPSTNQIWRCPKKIAGWSYRILQGASQDRLGWLEVPPWLWTPPMKVNLLWFHEQWGHDWSTSS